MKLKKLKISQSLILPALILLSTFSVAGNFYSNKKRGKSTQLLVINCPPPPTVQSFSYTSPQCSNNGSAPVHTYPNFTPGGTFSATPFLSGLNPATGQINLSQAQPNTYTVTYYGSSCNCISTSTIMIAPAPSNPVVFGTTSLCVGSSATLTGSGAFNFLWNTGATTASIVVTPAATTVYTLSTTNTYSCTSKTTHTVTVKAKPVIGATSSTMCSGGSATLSAFSQPSSGAIYTWYPGPLSGQNVFVSPPVTTNYTLSTNLAGCTSTLVQPVTVVPSVTPVTAFSYIYPLCTNSGNPLPIVDFSFVPGGTFFGSDSVNVNAVSGQVNISGMSPGAYNVSYSLAAVGCTVAATGTAFFVLSPVSYLQAVSQVTLAEGTSITLGAEGGVAYSWSPGLDLDCTECDHPTASPKQPIQYCVSDPTDGCATKACINVIVVCENRHSFNVPNAFTPDDNGNNDKFCLQGWSYCVTDFKILIYDRWGEKVFESTDPDFCWDGSFNGQKLGAGVFVYSITASINRAPVSVKKGNITLIR